MDVQQIKEIIRRELPVIVQEDPQMRHFVLELSRQEFAGRVETESRFDRLLDELRQDREEQSRKWAEQTRLWVEQRAEQAQLRADQNKRWSEQTQLWAEQRAEQAQLRAEQNKRWSEQTQLWAEQRAEQAQLRAEQDKKWAENQAVINRMLDSIEALSRKHDSTIGALGARWGLHSEQSFRNALKGILEEFFDIQVLNVVEFDDQGQVFGRPDQVELDVVIKNGLLILAEIKSSMSRADMYVFERKARFYERIHGRQAARLLVISPMVDQRAQAVADKLDIQVYSYAQDVDPAIFG